MYVLCRISSRFTYQLALTITGTDQNQPEAEQNRAGTDQKLTQILQEWPEVTISEIPQKDWLLFPLLLVSNAVRKSPPRDFSGGGGGGGELFLEPFRTYDNETYNPSETQVV